MHIAPEEFRDEMLEFGNLYLDRKDRSLTIGDIIEQHASDECKTYHEKTQRNFEEMNKACIAC